MSLKDTNSCSMKTPEKDTYKAFSQKPVVDIQPQDSYTMPRAEAASTDTIDTTPTASAPDTPITDGSGTDTKEEESSYVPRKKYITDAEERALKMERTLLALEPYLKLKYTPHEAFWLIMGKNKWKLPPSIFWYKQFHLYKCQDDVLDDEDGDKRFYSFQIEALSSSMDWMARENLFDWLRVKDPEYTKLALKVWISWKDFQWETVIRVRGPDHWQDHVSILQNTLHLLGDWAVDADYEELP